MSKVFEYKFNNNDQYEAEWEDSIFSFEEISIEEFEKIIKKAYAECEKIHPVYEGDVDFMMVRNKVLELDKRFFSPKLMATAFIGGIHDVKSDDYDCSNKIRYIYDHNNNEVKK